MYTVFIVNPLLIIFYSLFTTIFIIIIICHIYFVCLCIYIIDKTSYNVKSKNCIQFLRYTQDY